jgi:predicted permease
VRLSGAGYDEVRGREFSRILLERLNNLPGVEAASMAENPSLFVHGFFSEVRSEEHGEADASLISTNIVTEGYFDTIHMPILQGRAFSTVDHRESVRVAIVNETLVQRFWPDEDPLGKRFRLDNEEEWIEVVGVAKQSKYFTMGEPPQPYIYLHSLQSYRADVTFFVRAAGNPKNLISAVRQEIKALEIDMPILNLRTVNDLITESLWATRMAVGLLGFFGVLALCLAAIGVYGITAYTVNQRRTEFGMRMALGARRTDLAGLLFKEITVVMLLGLGIGWISTFILGRTLDRLLYGVDTSALLPLIGTSLFLAAIVLIASVFPVYRATASDPAAALRVE